MIAEAEHFGAIIQREAASFSRHGRLSKVSRQLLDLVGQRKRKYRLQDFARSGCGGQCACKTLSIDFHCGIDFTVGFANLWYETSR